MSEPKKITREDLYERIWKLPATKLSKELGISDVALAKICRKLQVPRPGSGHWRLVQLGWKVEQPPLLMLPEGIAREAIIDPEPHRRRKADTGENPKPEKPDYEVVPVPGTLHGAHAIVSRVRRSLEAEKPGQGGVVEVPYKLKVLNVSVSRSQTSRALRILDALVKALERRGGTFVESEEKDIHFMTLRIEGEWVGFELAELVAKTEREPKDAKERDYWSWNWDKWQYSATGRLRFRILESEPKGARRSWADCTQYQLDEKVGEIVHWMFITADGVKKARIIREEYWRRMEEERKHREEERQRQEDLRRQGERKRQIEESNRHRLEESSRGWFEARRLRRFIAACEAVLLDDHTSLPAGDWQHAWLSWAREHADRLDPMRNGFLEEEHQRITDQGISEAK